MNIITQLFILTLSLQLVNADLYCTNLYKDFKHKCTPSMITIRSCCDLNTFSPPPGVYKMSTRTFGTSDVYCDTATDGGGWIVIARNKKDSIVDFNKNWTDYERGFGDLKTEFWYGLDVTHCLTEHGQWEMRVDYQYFNKTWSYLHYNQFSVGSASEEYPLTVGGFTGIGRDLFALSNGLKFSTPDNDNDNWQNGNKNCAAHFRSGWWYKICGFIVFNYQPNPIIKYHTLIAEMKIRPKDCITH